MENARFRLLDNKAFLNPDPFAKTGFLNSSNYSTYQLM